MKSTYPFQFRTIGSQASERKVSYEEGLQLARRQGLKLSDLVLEIIRDAKRNGKIHLKACRNCGGQMVVVVVMMMMLMIMTIIIIDYYYYHDLCLRIYGNMDIICGPQNLRVNHGKASFAVPFFDPDVHPWEFSPCLKSHVQCILDVLFVAAATLTPDMASK